MISKEARRLKILTIAAQIFLDKGYERASMDEINKAIGCSKGTLYRYFPSKEELFLEAAVVKVSEEINNIIHAIHELKNSRETLSDALIQFGISYLKLNLSPVMIKINRIIIAEAERENIGALLYQRGQMRGWGPVAEFFATLMEEGAIRKADPTMVAQQLKGLFDAGLLDKRLRGAISDITDSDIQMYIEMAVDTFMRAYKQ